MPPGAPDIPGLECSGTVVKTGEGVSEWQVGDQVLRADGRPTAYSEYAARSRRCKCLPVPAGVGDRRCRRPAGNLFHRVDQCLRANAPAGGRSFPGAGRDERRRHHRHPARQGLRRQGLLATAGTDEKCRGVPRLRRRLSRSTIAPRIFVQGRQGIHRWPAASTRSSTWFGGNYIPPQLELLAREGRLCFVALMQGAKVEADFGLVQRKHLTVTGSTLRSRNGSSRRPRSSLH